MKKKLKKIYFRPDFYYETANDFCLHLGITPDDIANLTGCHTKTASNWIKNDNPPVWLLPFLYAAYGRVISSKGFDGWILNDGLVDTPANRYSLTSVQIETYYWHLDTLKQLQTKLHDYRQKAIAKKNDHQQTAVILQFPG